MRGQKQAKAHPRTAPETGMMVMEMFDAVKREWTAINVLLRAKKWLDPVTNESTDLLADDLNTAGAITRLHAMAREIAAITGRTFKAPTGKSDPANQPLGCAWQLIQQDRKFQQFKEK